MRLSARAAQELEQPAALSELRAWLEAHGLYVFTLNGFPYGDFHGAVVKERVYAPDWRTPERRVYSDRLAEILAYLLPDGETFGSVSSVPCGFGAALQDAREVARCAEQLLEHAARLVDLARRTGKHIALALEPEPFCLLETSSDAVAFFEQHLFARTAVEWFAARTGLSRPAAEAALRGHLGVCLDACHVAVSFEAPSAALANLRRAGIAVPKVQISAGLELAFERADPALLDALSRFDDGVYLHQVFEQSAQGQARYLDLAEAIDCARRAPAVARRFRVHFHVPVCAAQLGAFSSTQSELKALLAELATFDGAPHLEVETYTWDVLPPEHRALEVSEAIARELTWAREELGR